jgi:hypothetical protein
MLLGFTKYVTVSGFTKMSIVINFFGQIKDKSVPSMKLNEDKNDSNLQKVNNFIMPFNFSHSIL